MATSIILRGRRISKPGVYTTVSASALEQRGPGPIGIVALVGAVEGGRPVTAQTDPDDFIHLTSPDQVLTMLKSGSLREAAAFCFNPASDENIPSGAAEIYCMKVNQALQGSASLSNALGTVLTLTSEDWGLFANQINVLIANGTVITAGKKLTTVFEATTETADDVGGTNAFTMYYRESTETDSIGGGWTAMKLQVLAGGLYARGTKTYVGKSTDITNPVVATHSITVASTLNNASKWIVIYGLDVTNAYVSERLQLDASGDATGIQTWNAIYGAVLYGTDGVTPSYPTTDNVVVNDGATVLITFTAATHKTRGVILPSEAWVGQVAIGFVGSAPWTVLLVGENSAGAVVTEKLSAATTEALTTATSWARITAVVLGQVISPGSVTLTAYVVNGVASAYTTLQRQADLFNSRSWVAASITYGFVWAFATGETEMSPASLDYSQGDGTGASIYGSTGVGFTADLNAVASAWNSSSDLVTAARVTFTGKSYKVIPVPGDPVAPPWGFVLNGVLYETSEGTTKATISAALLALVNKATAVNYLVSGVVNTDGDLVLTALTPAGFTIAAGVHTSIVAIVAVCAGVGGPPLNTVSPIFLSGGSEGGTPAVGTEWTNAINRIRQVRVNTVVPLTGDPAVHALCRTLAINQDGTNEFDVIVGIRGDDEADLPTKAQVKTAIVNLNSKFVRACAQSIDRYNTAGVQATFMPWFQAALVAGMEAGAAVGMPLTNKYVNVIKFAQESSASSWNPVDDANEMIQAGLVFFETVPNVGKRLVRNVTTYLKSDNLAFIEGSVVHVVNIFAYGFRQYMEYVVGLPGFAGTVNAALASAQSYCDQQVADKVIADHTRPTGKLSGDKLAISVQIAPPMPINFVPVNIYLSAATITA